MKFPAMKTIITVFIFALCLYSAAAQDRSAEFSKGPGYVKTVNSQWTFNYFSDERADNGYESQGFDDSKWPVISLPHTWSTYETTGDAHPFIKNIIENDNPYWWTGWGWYRKHFQVIGSLTGRRIFIEFDGVQKYCKVWINGKYLGDHRGGYGSFDFDITGYLNEGKDNVIAVAVNNRQNDKLRIPPMVAGNFDVYGGIYRDARIVIKDKLHIPMQGSASHEGGTFVLTPGVTEEKGNLRILTWVRNDYAQPKECTLNTSLIDASGKTIQTVKTKYTIHPGQTYKFDQTFKPVRKPHLWSNSSPYLYQLYSEVTDGSRVTDSFTTQFGFRWFRWNFSENALYLNGEKMEIHGGNRLQDFPWLGDAVPKWISAMDIADMAGNLNYNFIRTACYPNDRYVYDLTDKYGVVTEEETPSVGDQNFSIEVQQQQMMEMIRRDRNHPSILFWGMGSETSHAVDSRFAVAEDTSRILTANHVPNGSAGAYVKHTSVNLPFDLLSRCTVRGWYNKDVRDAEPADAKQCGTEEYQRKMMEAAFKTGSGNVCTWIYEDHGAGLEFSGSPVSDIDPEGFVDSYRIPKYAYYLWQANYGAKPMVFIQPHFWRTQYAGQKKDIVVFSNCDKVELKVNGVSKGAMVPDKGNYHTVVFRDIQVENGTVSALATKDGRTVTAQVKMAGDPARIVLKMSDRKLEADKSSVAIITADIVDSNGSHVYGAGNTLKWSVSGPATLAGPAMYESDTDRHQSPEGVWYIDAPVSNVIRSNGKEGRIHVTVSASGLASGSLDIDAAAAGSDNLVISEPVLNDVGRKPVSRPTFLVDRLNDIPQEVKPANDEIKFNPQDRNGYLTSVRNYIVAANTSVDSTTVEFRVLADLLATHLVNNNGRMTADDYTFDIGNYNNCRLISSYINSLKLPPLFRDGLKKYYADLVITKGIEKNAGDEMNWMNWIPSGGTVVICQDGPLPAWPKGTVVTEKTELGDLIALVYPVFAKYNPEARDRALTFTAKMNPYVRVNTSAGQAGEGDNGAQVKTTYTADKGKPVLIPLIKFIAQ